MNQVARILHNVMRIEVLLGIGLMVWVFSFDAKAQSFRCPVPLDKAESLVAQAADLNARDYEEALQKCIAGKPLNNVERMLANTAEEFFGRMTPEAMEARQELKQTMEQKKDREKIEKQLQRYREEQAQLAEIREKQATIEKKESALKLANDFSIIAGAKMLTHKKDMEVESSAVRATTAELRLLNELTLLTIEQNDKILKYMEEQKKDQ